MGKIVIGTAATGNLNTVVAGTITPGTAVQNVNEMAPGTLSCHWLIDAETNTITIEGGWQVSNDNSTWLEVADQNNTAITVLGTGTAGADASVNKVMPAPMAVYGWKYARPFVRNKVVTGNSADTYSMTTHYRQKDHTLGL